MGLVSTGNRGGGGSSLSYKKRAPCGQTCCVREPGRGIFFFPSSQYPPQCLPAWLLLFSHATRGCADIIVAAHGYDVWKLYDRQSAAVDGRKHGCGSRWHEGYHFSRQERSDRPPELQFVGKFGVCSRAIQNVASVGHLDERRVLVSAIHVGGPIRRPRH